MRLRGPKTVRRIFVDIETLPPDRNSSESSVRAELSSCSDEEFRRLALDGDFGRVLTVGLIIEHDGEVMHRGLLGRDKQCGGGYLRLLFDEGFRIVM